MIPLQQSVIVAAHPDDEALWFSSILAKVDRVILCYLPVASKPEWTSGRRQVIADYPLPDISCLELEESEAFWCVDWRHPVKTQYGLKITDGAHPNAIYKNNYEQLVDRLREQLRGCVSVFTHNPWGEYGHVEHVQVYRAVRFLQSELQFKLWYTGYVSNKSAYLMAGEYSTIGPNSGELRTNKPLAESLADLYKRNHCWTWYDDYEWCDHETFILDIDDPQKKERKGSVLSLNMIDIGLDPSMKTGTRPWFRRLRIKKKLRRLLGQKLKVD